MSKLIEVVEEDRQHWRVYIPVEEGELQLVIQPEGLVVELVNENQEVLHVLWDTWEDLRGKAVEEG